MSRKRRRIRANRARRVVDLNEVYEWIEKSNTPPGGWQNASPFEAEIAKQKIYFAKRAANRVYNLQNSQLNFQRPVSDKINHQQRRKIYQEGYTAAEEEYRARMQELQRREAALQRRPPQHVMPSPQELERARMDGYAQGVVAGRNLAQQEFRPSGPSPQEMARVRQEMREAMLEECRVIAESNPNMAPGVNAVRHRIRKID